MLFRVHVVVGPPRSPRALESLEHTLATRAAWGSAWAWAWASAVAGVGAVPGRRAGRGVHRGCMTVWLLVLYRTVVPVRRTFVLYLL